MIDPELQQRMISSLLMSSIGWRVGALHVGSQERAVRWIAITTLTSPDVAIGISEELHWLKANGSIVTLYQTDAPCVFLLPVLEYPWDQFRDALIGGLRRLMLPVEFSETFPIDDVIQTGLTSNSTHWVSLALAWAQVHKASSAIQGALRTVARSGPTQQIRHAALKLTR